MENTPKSNRSIKMENFSKSTRGIKYYDRDVPQLINMLSRIAEAMEVQNKLTKEKMIFEKKKFILEQKSIPFSNSSES